MFNAKVSVFDSAIAYHHSYSNIPSSTFSLHIILCRFLKNLVSFSGERPGSGNVSSFSQRTLSSSPLFGSSTPRDKFSVLRRLHPWTRPCNGRDRDRYGEHSLAWFYCRYFRRSAEISCLAERLNLVTDSLYFIHIMWHLDACFLELRLLGGSLSEREHVKHRGGGN